MERDKRIRRKIIKSLRQGIKTPEELVKSFKHIKEVDTRRVVSKMLLDGELILDQKYKLDLWRPK